MRGRCPTPIAVLAAGLLSSAGCAPESEAPMTGESAESTRLGPHDGLDLPATDLDRLAVGDLAPDFTLRSFDGGTVTLSDYRGEKVVLLVLYRGHW